MTIPSTVNGVVKAREINMPSIETYPAKVAASPISKPDIDIIDIRQDAVEMYLKDEIFKQLKPTAGLKTLPTLLLYNEKGLQIYEEVRRPGIEGYHCHTDM